MHDNKANSAALNENVTKLWQCGRAHAVVLAGQRALEQPVELLEHVTRAEFGVRVTPLAHAVVVLTQQKVAMMEPFQRRSCLTARVAGQQLLELHAHAAFGSANVRANKTAQLLFVRDAWGALGVRLQDLEGSSHHAKDLVAQFALRAVALLNSGSLCGRHSFQNFFFFNQGVLAGGGGGGGHSLGVAEVTWVKV